MKQLEMWDTLTREELVKEFHEAFGHKTNLPLTRDYLELRMNLLEEELSEIYDASQFLLENQTNKKAKENLLKELCDLQYVLSGLAVSIGLDLEHAFIRVHQSNMSKLGDDGKPVYREDGKVMKGPNYQKPYLGDLV